MMLKNYADAGDMQNFAAVGAGFILTQVSLVIAVNHIIHKRIQQHRIWMLRCYGWNTAIVTIRFILPILWAVPIFRGTHTHVAYSCKALGEEWDPAITAKYMNTSAFVYQDDQCNLTTGEGYAYFTPSPSFIVEQVTPDGEYYGGPNPAAVHLSFGVGIWLAILIHGVIIESWINYRYAEHLGGHKKKEPAKPAVPELEINPVSEPVAVAQAMVEA